MAVPTRSWRLVHCPNGLSTHPPSGDANVSGENSAGLRTEASSQGLEYQPGVETETGIRPE